MLSDHNAIKLEFNNKRNSRKHSNTWKLNNTLLRDQRVIKEIKDEIKSSWNLIRICQNLYDTTKECL
jgi:hypothetical protein